MTFTSPLILELDQRLMFLVRLQKELENHSKSGDYQSIDTTNICIAITELGRNLLPNTPYILDNGEGMWVIEKGGHKVQIRRAYCIHGTKRRREIDLQHSGGTLQKRQGTSQ